MTWIDDSFTDTGHYRQVNMVLGNLFRLHWPGLVTFSSGESVPPPLGSIIVMVSVERLATQALVWDAFWV
jgi:hypothetical protein